MLNKGTILDSSGGLREQFERFRLIFALRKFFQILNFALNVFYYVLPVLQIKRSSKRYAQLLRQNAQR